MVCNVADLEPVRLRSCAWLALAAALAGIGPSLACQERPLVARRITAETAAQDVLGGADATGGIGDWRLSNGIVEAIVDDVGWQEDLRAATGTRAPIQTGLAPTGGFLVDLGLEGIDGDGIGVLLPVNELFGNTSFHAFPAGEILGDESLPSVIAEVDAAAGEARLVVHGRMRVEANVPIRDQTNRFRQTYALRRGEGFLRLRTEIENLGAAPIDVGRIADASMLGQGGAMAFVPHAARGFALGGGEVPVPFVTQFGAAVDRDGAPGPPGEISYTLWSPEVPWLVDASNGSTLLASAPTAPRIAPGETWTYERRVHVGWRNDVASSAAPALRAIAAQRGIGVGHVRGRIVDPDGRPFRAAVSLVLDDLSPATPERETLTTAYDGNGAPQRLLEIRTDSSERLGGRFETDLPAGAYTARISVEERDPIAQVGFEVPPGGHVDLGTFTLPSVGTLRFDVTDATSGLALPARLVVKGLGNPDPKLGEPLELSVDGAPIGVQARAGQPWGNSVATATGSGELTLRPGSYRVIASRGVEYDVAWSDVSIPAGGTRSVAFALTRQVDTSGWIAADFHVHAAASADSSVPAQDRIATLSGEGIEVVVAADHDVVFDYAPVIESMGMGGWIASRPGAEISSSRAPAPAASGVGHYNAWPLARQPHARRRGAPEDEGVEPSVLIDRLRGLGATVVQLNHPLWDKLGLLSNLAYDPLLPLGAAPNDYLLRTSALGTGTRNLDFDAIEIMNGVVNAQFGRARDVWLGLLQQGERITATAAGDTHGLHAQSIGGARSYVAVPNDDPAGFDPQAFDAAVGAMQVIGTSGPFLEVELAGGSGSAGLGETLSAAPNEPLALHVRVQAPCWLQVGPAWVYANGMLLLQIPIENEPCTGPLRYDGEVTIALAADAFLTVETVERVPRDTSTFQKQLSTYVLGGRVLRAFTNPIYVDTNGNGVFDPPGL